MLISGSRISVFLCAGAWLVVACWAPRACGQARSTVSMNSVGRLRRIGENTSGYTFGQYSYGIGSLRSGGGAPSGVLSGSLSRGSFSLRRSPALGLSSALRSNISSSGLGGSRRSRRAAANAGIKIAPASTGSRLYGATGLKMVLGAVAGKTRPMNPSVAASLGAVDGYLSSLAASPTPGAALTGGTRSITSFVPAEKSIFADFIASGERAFRAGNFGEAFDRFQLAGYIASRAPETLLSMAQAKIAVSRFSYSSASHYLKEALKYFPELPLAPLKPRGFYGKEVTYVEHLIRLEEYLDNNPYDADAALCMAYLRWFDGDADATRAALSKALGTAIASHDAGMIEAVNIFWDGCIASGKVAGKLQPTTRPAAKPAGGRKAAVETGENVR